MILFYNAACEMFTFYGPFDRNISRHRGCRKGNEYPAIIDIKNNPMIIDLGKFNKLAKCMMIRYEAP